MKAVFNKKTGELVSLNPPANFRSRTIIDAETKAAVFKDYVRELSAEEVAILMPPDGYPADVTPVYRDINGLLEVTTIARSPKVPREIANWRARAVLELAGYLPAVQSAIAGMGGAAGVVARAAWLAGAPLARRGATVVALAAALELTDAQVDAMFIQAASLAV